jgi:hypothetical protein
MADSREVRKYSLVQIAQQSRDLILPVWDLGFLSVGQDFESSTIVGATTKEFAVHCYFINSIDLLP